MFILLNFSPLKEKENSVSNIKHQIDTQNNMSILYLILAFPRCLIRERTGQLFWM